VFHPMKIDLVERALENCAGSANNVDAGSLLFQSEAKRRVFSVGYKLTNGGFRPLMLTEL